MKLLLSNDDGHRALGLRHLADALGAVAEVTVVAPDRDRSGASNSLTLDRPLRVERDEAGFSFVNGTPTDCVHLAITGLLDEEPDMVISGINSGANMGDDVLYSGTVAAAMEGRFLGLPSMAVSLVLSGAGHYDTAARVVRGLIARVSEVTMPPASILNVNVPDLPYHRLRGVKATRLGHRHKAEPVVRAKDPRGGTIYWVGPPGSAQDAGEGTDFDAVREGFVSVTPIAVDLTRHSALDAAREWASRIEL
jgi:5'-nucleotidase